MRVPVVPVVVGVQEHLEIGGRSYTIWITVFLSSAKILRRVLDTRRAYELTPVCKKTRNEYNNSNNNNNIAGGPGVMVIAVGNGHDDTSFKSWTTLIAFHIALIPLGKVWIQLFSLQLSVNSIVAYWPLAELSNKSCTCVNNRCIRSKISGYNLDSGRAELGADVTPARSRWT